MSRNSLSPAETACLHREMEDIRPLADAGAVVLVDVLAPDGTTLLTTKVTAAGLLAAMDQVRILAEAVE